MDAKHRTIRFIADVIRTQWGIDFFTDVDFWDADNCAMGIIRDNRLIYISTWDFREEKDFRCFCELEIIDEATRETVAIAGQYDALEREALLGVIRQFVNNESY